MSKAFGIRENKSIVEVLVNLEHMKSTTVHKLTGFENSRGVVPCVFKATANYEVGDTIEIDDITYQIVMSDGGTPNNGLFVAGAVVSVVVDVEAKEINFGSNSEWKKEVRRLDNEVELMKLVLSGTIAENFFTIDKTDVEIIGGCYDELNKKYYINEV